MLFVRADVYLLIAMSECCVCVCVCLSCILHKIKKCFGCSDRKFESAKCRIPSRNVMSLLSAVVVVVVFAAHFIVVFALHFVNFTVRSLDVYGNAMCFGIFVS